MDAVFHALAHRARRRMLDILTATPGLSVGDVSDRFEISRVAVMKHLRALEAAGLVISKAEGRTRRLFANVAPIQMIHDRWTSEYSRFWARRVTDVKYALEQGLGQGDAGTVGGGETDDSDANDQGTST